MPTEPTTSPQQARLSGIAATIALHVALVALWLLQSTPARLDDGVPRVALQWVDIRPDVHVVTKPLPQAAPPLRLVKPAPKRAAVIAPPLASQPVPAEIPPREPAEPAPVPLPAATGPTVHDMLQQARRDVGQIDKDLKKQFPERLIKAPIDTATKRLVKGIALAHDLAPPKWYQPAKMEELIDPGGVGRKRYRVITSGGTYCLTYESAHSMNGTDPFTRTTNRPKKTNCPADEEPAKAQAW